jgi:hypothetical protein
MYPREKRLFRPDQQDVADYYGNILTVYPAGTKLFGEV